MKTGAFLFDGRKDLNGSPVNAEGDFVFAVAIEINALQRHRCSGNLDATFGRGNHPKGAVSLSFKKKPDARIVVADLRLRAVEILSEEAVYLSIAVEVFEEEAIDRRKLGHARERRDLEGSGAIV